jgi:hypothetical protein
MLAGQGLKDVGLELGVLAGFTALTSILAALATRRSAV